MRAFASSRSSIPSSSSPSIRMTKRQGQPLADERRQDHREREEEDQVASGERRAGVRLERQRERGRERDRAAHPGPGEEHGAAPVRHPPRDPLRRVEHGEDPREAQDDHGEADERRVAEEPRRGHVAERVDDDRELEADEHEQERVQEVLDDLPHRDALQPHLGSRQLRRVPAEVDPRRDGGEHGRDAHQLGRDERDVAGEERDRDLRRRVVEAPADLPRRSSRRRARPRCRRPR